MKTFTKLVICTIVAASTLAGCAPKAKSDPRQLTEAQARELADVGTKQFEIQWTGPPKGAGEHGVAAVTDGVTTLTTHTGYRVFIVHNRKEYPPSDSNAFQGTDEELKNIGVKFLKACGVRAEEIADLQVLQQFTQLAERSADGKSVRVEAPRKSYRALLVNRRVGGVDAPSSHLLLNVNAAGRIAFMELNWPDVGREVVDRAAQLRKLLDSGYAAPRIEAAEVESFQPVLLNSPAVGFYNDSIAAIRVIYRASAAQVGQKAVRYIDERGADVTMPRDIDRPREATLTRQRAN